MSADSSVVDLFVYPVKGLSAQPLDEVCLTAGKGFPNDRLYGFARADSGFRQDDPKPMPKHKFLVLAQEAALAHLATKFDPVKQSLEIEQHGLVSNFDLGSDEGRAAAATYLGEYLNLSKDKMPSIAHAAPHRFTDVSMVSEQMMNAVSFVNMESVRDFEQKTGSSIDPDRFRANLVIDGWPAFSELDMVDREFTVGEARFKVILGTRRCAATQVNPSNAERDLEIPKLLHKHYGHVDMGIYAEVIKGGIVKKGAKVELA